MAQTNRLSSSRSPISFFDLPAELRDLVYDELRTHIPATTKEQRDESASLEAWVEGAPLTARLLSREFKEELDARLREGQTTLRVHDDGEYIIPRLNRYAAKKTTHVDISVILESKCRRSMTNDADFLIAYIMRPLANELAHKCSVHAQLYIQCDHEAKHHSTSEKQGQSLVRQLVDEGLTNMTLHRGISGRVKGGHYARDDSWTLCATWDGEHGFQASLREGEGSMGGI